MQLLCSTQEKNSSQEMPIVAKDSNGKIHQTKKQKKQHHLRASHVPLRCSNDVLVNLKRSVISHCWLRINFIYIINEITPLKHRGHSHIQIIQQELHLGPNFTRCSVFVFGVGRLSFGFWSVGQTKRVHWALRTSGLSLILGSVPPSSTQRLANIGAASAKINWF